MKFVNFNPEDLIEKEWNEYNDCRERIHLEQNPQDPLPSREHRRSYMLDPHPDYKLSWWRAESADGLIVGLGGVWWATPNATNYEEAKDTAYADMILEQRFANKQNETEFLKRLVNKAHQLGKDKLIIETRAEHQRHLFTALGGNSVSERATYRLRLSEVDIQMIKRWRQEGPRRAPGVRIERFKSVPDEDIEEYSEIYTETWNQAPLENAAPEMIVTPESRRKMEKYFEKHGEIWTSMVSKEQDGTISGLTEIWYTPEFSYRIEQGLTGVRNQYRGRGLGKWLKAEMLMYAMSKYPEAMVIETGNADANTPMRSINEQLGFKLHKNLWILSFKITDLLAEL